MRRGFALPLAILVLACAGCGSSVEGDGSTEPPFIQSGDLAEIQNSGKLRILLPVQAQAQVTHLPRRGSSSDLDRELAEAYAAHLGVEPVFVYVASRDRLIPSLLEGKGDFVAANLTVTPERKKRVSFTVPVAMVREQLVARVDDETLEGPQDLRGRRIALRRSSSFWKTVADLRASYPGIEIEEVPEDVDTEEMIHRVARGRYDLTVADSNLVDICLEYRDDIRMAFDLTLDRPIAWAVRPRSAALLASLNRFLSDGKLARRHDTIHLEDWAGIKDRRVLRMLTRNNSATYFLWRGELMGFEYELAKAFAKKHRLRLEVIVPPTGEDLLPWLYEGRGDFVAAGLTPTEERRKSGASFSRPYNFVSQVIVARADEEELNEPADLAGREVHVRRSSAYWETLDKLRESGVAVEIVAVSETLETEEIIDGVATGEFDLTLADSHILDIELNWRDDIKEAFPLTDSMPLCWAVRESNPELEAAIDEFITENYRGLFYNVVYNKYFRNAPRIRAQKEARRNANETLSPYDELVKKYADRYGFDWRLIVSQMYQESRFDPEAVSFAGAGGLLQVLPNTAMEQGFANIGDPEEGIHAGIKYLHWLRDRFEPELPVRDRMWFTLAAYNAGPGHVRDARRIAEEINLNPNRWFGNVERAMYLLSRREYASRAPHGYCRCSEPVNYVREIRSRYNAYLDSIGS